MAKNRDWPEVMMEQVTVTEEISDDELLDIVNGTWNPVEDGLTPEKALFRDMTAIGIRMGILWQGDDFLVKIGTPKKVVDTYIEQRTEEAAKAVADMLHLPDYRPLMMKGNRTKEQEKALADVLSKARFNDIFRYLYSNYNRAAMICTQTFLEEMGLPQDNPAAITAVDDYDTDIAPAISFLVRYFFALHGRLRAEGVEAIYPAESDSMTDDQREEIADLVKKLSSHKKKHGGNLYEDAFLCFGMDALLPIAKQPIVGDLPGLFKISPTTRSYTSAAIDALALARTIGKKDPINKTLLKIRNVEITSNEISKLGVGEQKLLRYAISMFTKENGPNEKNPKLNVYGSTRDFANACITDPEKGITPRTMDTPEEQEKENQRADKALDNFKTKLRKNAEALRMAGFRWTETTQGKRKAYSGLSFISFYRIDDDVITIQFSQAAAEMLVQRPLSETPRALYAISDTNPNAYAMAEAMAKHCGIYNNVMANTEQVLKVETLLSYTTLANFDANGRKRSQWEERVKEPFERSLDEMTAKGFLRVNSDGTGGWQYVKAGQIPITDEDAQNITSYAQWLSLYVKFDLADFTPHEERRKMIADRKEAGKNQAARKRKNRKKEPQRESLVT